MRSTKTTERFPQTYGFGQGFWLFALTKGHQVCWKLIGSKCHLSLTSVVLKDGPYLNRESRGMTAQGKSYSCPEVCRFVFVLTNRSLPFIIRAKISMSMDGQTLRVLLHLLFLEDKGVRSVSSLFFWNIHWGDELQKSCGLSGVSCDFFYFLLFHILYFILKLVLWMVLEQISLCHLCNSDAQNINYSEKREL